jgi:uncharacterized membrane protein
MRRLRGLSRRVRRGGATALAPLLVVALAGSTSAASGTIDASVRIAPLEVSLTLSALQARVGDSLRARAVVQNLGSTPVSNVVVELRVDSLGLSVRGSAVVIIPRIQARHSATASWTVCALQEGNFVVLARATGDGASVDSLARVVSIVGRRNRGCT